MIKHYYFYGDWRKKDLQFFRSLDVKADVEGSRFIYVPEGAIYEKITQYFSKKDSLFTKTKPKDYCSELMQVSFSKSELDAANYYAMNSMGGEAPPALWPRPDNYLETTFMGELYTVGRVTRMNNKIQINPFRIIKPRGNKKICFNLGLEYEYICFKKSFFLEVLAPLGLQYIEVLNHKTGLPLEDTVQMIIPLAKSTVLLEGSAYDIHNKEETDGFKQYAIQSLDFFPPFAKEVADFHICYTNENFYGGKRKIIITKSFCNLLVEHNIIKYDYGHLIPLAKRD